ncbi:type I restriction enzyme, S subunit [Gammaproteobacteria bacterium]
MTPKNKTRRNEPNLRFPEFREAGEWEERKLGTVCEIQRGKFSHRPRNDPKFFGGQYPFIQTGDVVKSAGGAVIASQSLNEEGLAVSKLFKPTIVLITIAANIGDTGVLQTEGCFTDSVVGLIPKQDVIPVFLELIMRGQKEYLNKVATTGAQKNINNEILREVSVLLPSVPEQQKIADCLTSLDDLITAETQKVEALKKHKKGLMQQLFPREGETVPNLRFPEFREAGEWEEKKLDEICDVNPESSKLPEVFVYIDLEAVEAGELKANKVISKKEAPSRAQRLLKIGDVIYQIVRPYQRNNFFFKINDGNNYVASTGYAQLRAFESNDFLFQIVHTDEFVERVIAKCTGSNYPAINSSDLAEIPVAIPLPPEQQKIADCLSSLDDLITAETQKLAALKKHKKGLMQQLFPSPADVAE